MKLIRICALLSVAACVASSQAKSPDVSSSFSTYVTGHNQNLAGVNVAPTTSGSAASVSLGGTSGTTNFGSHNGGFNPPSSSPEPFTMGLSLVMVGTWVSRKLKRA